ncbi:hypothetical protein HN832_03890 [archaeon]|jgi:hypothetical protein|nr:hypothetical protein [archaeon]MBT4373464.1 hypothetical protein [archaeon]MBT4531912.1 hypothetical protein [archaeon]MBT7001579.1 hypothetical protein [archaeon]MBT7282529.1 hypothetical protein [archaeon]
MNKRNFPVILDRNEVEQLGIDLNKLTPARNCYTPYRSSWFSNKRTESKLERDIHNDLRKNGGDLAVIQGTLGVDPFSWSYNIYNFPEDEAEQN